MNVIRKSPFLLVWAVLILVSCAPKGNQGSSLLGTTGHVSPEGEEYVHNGDDRIDEALKQPEVDPPATRGTLPDTKAGPKNAPQKQTLAAKRLRERLKEFEISRYHAKETSPARFGEQRVVLKVIFKDGAKSLEFKAPLTGAKPKFRVNASLSGFTLVGELVDSEEQTKGEFYLTNESTQDTARIFYWAYKAKLTVRQNLTRKVVEGSTFEKQLADLRENTFSWVNNWSVLRGPSFFLVDVVKLVDANSPAPKSSILSFKGPSLRTGDKVYEVDEIAGTPSTIQLVGNSEVGAGRMFQVNIQDPETKENNEFMLDVEVEPQTQTAPGQQPVTIPDEPAEEPEAVEEVVLPTDNIPVPTPRPDRPHQQQPVQPVQPEQPIQPVQPQQPEQPVQEEPVRVVGKSYLRISTSLPRTTRMTRDFNRNRNLRGVKTWLERYRNPESKWHPGLQQFYNAANSFRRIMEKVGQTFDVSPAYAYVTVIESKYFTGGKFEIEGAKSSTALGPFQLLIGTADEVGLQVYANERAADERRFFVPSSCGAARYFRSLVKKFENYDTTVAILGYYQGGTGAQKLTREYGYTYAKVEEMAAIPLEMRDYVNKKLAIYFISNDPAKYGFEIKAATAKPTRAADGTVMPARGIKDNECEQATQGLY